MPGVVHKMQHMMFLKITSGSEPMVCSVLLLIRWTVVGGTYVLMHVAFDSSICFVTLILIVIVVAVVGSGSCGNGLVFG